MKKEDGNIEPGGGATKEQAAQSPPPPPPPPLPRLWATKIVAESVTNQEIAKFWRLKRIEEEDHFLSAIKAAAKLRARNLSEEDYKCFVESLEDDDNNNNTTAEKSTALRNDNNNENEHSNEVRVGIKDWWTKSKYAYLNQPAIGSNNPPKRRNSTYVPNLFSFKPSAPLYPTSLGVF